MLKRTFKADSLLFLAAFIWGTAFVAQRKGMDYVGPLTYTGLRFLLGAVVLLPVLLYVANTRTNIKLSTKYLLPCGILAGLVLFAGAALQQIGLVTTTASKAGFITGLYVTFVPFIGLLLGHRIGAGTWAGCAAAFFGMYLLCIEDTYIVEKGDLLVLSSAVFWAVHVQLIGYLVKRFNPLPLAIIQNLTCGTLGLLFAVFTENISAEAITQAGIPIFYGGVMSVGIAFTLQVVSQQVCPPTHAAIIMSLEMAIAALAGWIILGEVLDSVDIAGCALMFAGVLVVQLTPLVKKRIASSGG